MSGRHRLDDGGVSMATTIRQAMIREYVTAAVLTWPNPFLAPSLPAVAPGNVKAERQGRNSFGRLRGLA
ncbi:hypothetical protein [Gordonia terrae]|uniref:hypothetical protein n=1 Tax=Gordonia terrae TaxID=2055 RepID=UPI003F6D9D73